LIYYSFKNLVKHGALREIGRIERTLFTLDWLKNIDLRRRANAGVNKGEARNALPRAIFFYRLGEIRDRRLSRTSRRLAGSISV
jgi:TnpA family transposase